MASKEINGLIRFKTGDLLAEDVEALVNTVNCYGVMGKGIALQFKERFPDNFLAYAEACERGEVRPGRMFVFETGAPAGPRFIINFPTKRHWRYPSRMGDIETGLDDLARVIQEHRIRSIAMPALGCGLGGLDWNDVRPRIEEALRGTPHLVDAVVFEPGDEPKATQPMRRRKKAPATRRAQRKMNSLFAQPRSPAARH